LEKKSKQFCPSLILATRGRKGFAVNNHMHLKGHKGRRKDRRKMKESRRRVGSAGAEEMTKGGKANFSSSALYLKTNACAK